MAVKKNNRSALLLVALIFALVAAGGVGWALYSANKQVSYWVVGTEVPARTKVTSAMLQEVKAREGSQPKAMTAAYVDSNDVYAKYELQPGDILTSSNAGPLEKITAGIPEDFSVSSFTVPATNAAVGMAKRGDYIDIYMVDSSNGQSTSSLVLQHVLVLDAVASLDDVSARESGGTSDSTDGSSDSSSSSPSSTSSVSTIYQVGLSREDTAKLALLSTKNLFVALSPATGASSTLPEEIGDINLTAPGDSGEGTDPTFSTGTDEDQPSESTGSEQTQQSGN